MIRRLMDELELTLFDVVMLAILSFIGAGLMYGIYFLLVAVRDSF